MGSPNGRQARAGFRSRANLGCHPGCAETERFLNRMRHLVNFEEVHMALPLSPRVCPVCDREYDELVEDENTRVYLHLRLLEKCVRKQDSEERYRLVNGGFVPIRLRW